MDKSVPFHEQNMNPYFSAASAAAGILGDVQQTAAQPGPKMFGFNNSPFQHPGSYQAQENPYDSGAAAMDGLGKVAQYAKTGAAFGAPGAAIGAAAGLGLGIYGLYKNEQNKAEHTRLEGLRKDQHTRAVAGYENSQQKEMGSVGLANNLGSRMYSGAMPF
jgi:hypothetical protein